MVLHISCHINCVYTFISIHLMLWFYNLQLKQSMLQITISIHLMLWFYTIQTDGKHHGCKFQYISCYGSTIEEDTSNLPLPKFQYISCYGSTAGVHSFIIEEWLFQYISCYGSTRYSKQIQKCNIISIHLMLWFYVILIFTSRGKAISIHLMLWFYVTETPEV